MTLLLTRVDYKKVNSVFGRQSERSVRLKSFWSNLNFQEILILQTPSLKEHFLHLLIVNYANAIRILDWKNTAYIEIIVSVMQLMVIVDFKKIQIN